ncbi:toxin-antitoxin system YwqK family antitoxin [Hymenobacter pini]|uniref:toxin-antitoxin system YwqK family antitoxin n=1 Tax=Hymenobacter pini TaxID=2880879 RepID=UPI001CF387E1|nr:hypothetical protein [Hymenobacter pini]MCA8833045.1 hypothetical protein [Hymenobacter pini]
MQRGPIGFWSRNRYHTADGRRHGPWREYFDTQRHHIANAGRYRHGMPVGHWRYFAPSGGLEREELFSRRPPGLLTIRYYHLNGQLAKVGQARYQFTDAAVKFFWVGEWKCYAETGQPQPSEFYSNGVKLDAPLRTPDGRTISGPNTIPVSPQ